MIDGIVITAEQAEALTKIELSPEPEEFLIVRHPRLAGKLFLAWTGTDENVPPGFRCAIFAEISPGGFYHPIDPKPEHYAMTLDSMARKAEEREAKVRKRGN